MNNSLRAGNIVHRLPTELLGEIFSLCRQSEAEAGIARYKTPLWTGQICRYWRTVALSIPLLWNTLHFRLPRTPAKPWLSDKANLARLLIERSGSSLLCIELEDVWYTRRKVNERKIAPFLKIITSTSPRWRTLVVHGDVLACAKFSSIKGHIPMLQELEFESSPCDPDTDVLDDAPALTSLTIRGFTDVSRIIMPCARLTTLTVLSSDAQRLLDLLRLTQALESLAFTGLFEELAFTTGSYPICLARLRCLKIASQQQGQKECDMVLGRLLTPVLTDLTVHASPWDYHGVIDLIKRSGCALVSLDVVPLFSGDSLIELLKVNFHLQHLAFRTFWHSLEDLLTPEHVFRILQYTQPPLAPALWTFSYTAPRNYIAIYLDALGSMLLEDNNANQILTSKRNNKNDIVFNLLRPTSGMPGTTFQVATADEDNENSICIRLYVDGRYDEGLKSNGDGSGRLRGDESF